MERYRVIVQTCDSATDPKSGKHETELTGSTPEGAKTHAEGLIKGDKSMHQQFGTPFCGAKIIRGPEKIEE